MLEKLQNQFRTIRGRQVVLDADVARFYGVSTKRLNEQVRRHPAKFPEDFAFRLTATEAADIRLELAHLRPGRGGSRHSPRVFTETGILTASYVLHSPQAIATSLTLVREIIASWRELDFGRDLHSEMDDIERRLRGDSSQENGFRGLVLEVDGRGAGITYAPRILLNRAFGL